LPVYWQPYCEQNPYCSGKPFYHAQIV
jgi:hypothetical protein